MDQLMIDQMEADAKRAAEEADGAGLTELGKRALDLEDEISSLEAAAKEKGKELERLMRYAIPTALTEAGIPGYDFEHNGGTARITSGIKVLGSLRNAPDEDAAVAYLEANGFSGAVKSTVAVEFTESEREEADRLMGAMKGITNRSPHLSRTIHPMTLMAFVREKLKEDPEFDYEKVGIVAFPQAQFTKRR